MEKTVDCSPSKGGGGEQGVVRDYGDDYRGLLGINKYQYIP